MVRSALRTVPDPEAPTCQAGAYASFGRERAAKGSKDAPFARKSGMHRPGSRPESELECDAMRKEGEASLKGKDGTVNGRGFSEPGARTVCVWEW